MNNLTKSITIHSAYGVETKKQETMTNLQKTIWTLAMHKGQAELKDGTIVTLIGVEHESDSVQERVIYKTKEGKLYKTYFYEIKPILHSLDKLTQEIDGKTHLRTALDENLIDSYDYERIVGKIDLNREIYLANYGYNFINYLLANHYNVFGLSSEFVKEK